MISTLLQPPLTTIPENLPVRYKGVTQLRLNSSLYILNLRKSTLAMASMIRLSVNTFSSRITVRLRQELLMCVQKMEYRVYSILISYSARGISLRQGTMSSEGRVLRGVRSPTSPTRIHSPPSSIIMSSFLLSIIICGYGYILNQPQRPLQTGMKLNEWVPLRGKERAAKLGLTSSRFEEQEMSENARAAVEYVKKRDRSDIKLDEWRTRKLYKTDATIQLFSCAENITRVHKDSLTVEQFVEQFQKKNMPVVIQGCASDWHIDKYWTFDYFYQQFKEVKFKIGEDDDGYKLRVPLKYYFEYLVYNKDDSPLYMFESSLENNKEMLPILEHYQVPPYFKDDLLKYAGQEKRPPYRWLLMGPERSGTTVHVDPLNTSAWNTSLQGHKRWVLFPQRVPKFIVKGKAFRGKNYEDEAINYFTEIVPKMIESEGRERLGIIEFVQRPGETVFVPGGWWHAVMNLDDTIAVTQNVMTHFNFDNVWRSIRSERRKFAHKYLEDLKQNEYSLYERAIELNTSENYQMGNKYEKQSVSMSFTGTESSSSSSSDSSDQAEDKKQNSKRSRSQNSREFSRSRNKREQKRPKSMNNRRRKSSF